MAKIDIAQARYGFRQRSLLDFRKGNSGVIAIVDGSASWDSGIEAANWVYDALTSKWGKAIPRRDADLSRDLLAAAASIPEEMRQGDDFSFAAVLIDRDSIQVFAAGS